MTKTFLRKYWIILISACCVSTGIILACADGSGFEYGTSNFTPQVFVANAYSPFFFSSQSYYGIGHDEAHNQRFNASNARDWAAYLGRKVPVEELEFLLDTATATSLDSAARWFEGKSSSAPPALRSFLLLTDKTDKKTAAFFHYLRLARQCETFSVNRILYSWERDEKKDTPVHFNATPLNKQLKEGLTSATDPFLRERYWFQLVRSHFYNNNPQQAIALFGEYDKKFPANTLYHRTLAFMAGAYYKLKDYSHANYYYSRVFDSCDDLKTVAHYSFHPQDESDWQATLALGRNNEEKATLWQMLGIFYSDPQRAIRQIYGLDPKSEKLELLLSRAVNQSEQRFKDGDDVSYYMPPAPSDSSNTALRTLVTRIADAGNTSKPWVWQLAAGYLGMLDEQYSVAASYYAKAEKRIPNEHLPQAQFRLLKLLNKVAAVKTLNRRIEQELLPDIEWLVNEQKDPDIRSYSAFEWLKRTMAAKYQSTGDVIRSECFFTQTAFYTDSVKVAALKAFFNNPKKTPYEELCTRLSEVKRQDISEYQAIRLCQDDRIDEAIKAMGEAPETSTTILPGNPFNARIQDCHDCDHAAPQKIKYSKLNFLQKLKDIKDKISAGKDVYTNAVLLGNARYNITHYGNGRAFTGCKIMGDWNEPDAIDTVFNGPLNSMKIAIKYYTLALNAAQTDEQKAKCQYLLAKCERNEWYNGGRPNEDRHDPDFIEWQGFKALKQYTNTQYYKDVIRECGYFKTYVQKQGSH